MRVTGRSLQEWSSTWNKSDKVEELESVLGPEDSSARSLKLSVRGSE